MTSNSPEAVADPASSSAAAPYGTRSRGRNAPRPNYAEDRDLEMELEPASNKAAKRNSGVVLNNIVNGSKSDGEKSSPVQSRKSLTNGTAVTAIPKESIPGTSSFSARPEEVNGTNGSNSPNPTNATTNGSGGSLRKRKQPASAPNAGSTGNATKKIFTAAPGDSDGGYFTNMVSFENTGPYLKDGKLIADDGTTFAVNGWFLHSLMRRLIFSALPSSFYNHHFARKKKQQQKKKTPIFVLFFIHAEKNY